MTSFQDLGGAEYTLRVNDEFARTFARLRKEFVDAQKNFQAFQQTAAGGAGGEAVAKDLRAAAAAQRELSRTSRALNNEQRQTARQIQQGARQQVQNERLRAAIVREQRAEARAEAQDFVRQAQARERAQAKELASFQRDQNARARAIAAGARQQQAAERERARILKAQRADQEAAAKASPGGGGLFGGIRSRVSDILAGTAAEKGFLASLKESITAGNQLGFTFRRLFGVLAVFTVAREAINGVVASIRSFFQFNAQTETSVNGIASLITTLGKVTDATGKPLQGIQEFTAAQVVARRQVDLLRVSLGQTTASFEELQQAFQVALGPGLSAGLGIDQIREFSVLVSQAAQAIQLPQNQLAEEIRALLKGTVQGRTTQLASIFGGTPAEINAAIETARRAGTLGDFLLKKLAPLSLAAEATGKSFTGLFAQVRNGFQLLGGTAIVPLFERVKTAMVGIRDALVVRAGTQILPNPQALTILATLFGGLKRAVDGFVGAFESLSFDDVLAITTNVADSLSVVAQAAAGALRGIFSAATLVSAVMGDLVRFFDSSGQSIGKAVEGFTAFFSSLLVGRAVLGAVVGLLNLLVGPLVTATILITKLTKAFIDLGSFGKKAVLGLGIVAALTAALVIAKQITDEVFGFEVAIEDFAAVVGTVITAALLVVAEAVKGVVVFAFNGMVSLAISTLSFLLDKVRGVLTSVGAAGSGIVGLETVSRKLLEGASTLGDAVVSLDKSSANFGKEAQKSFENIPKLIEQAGEDIDKIRDRAGEKDVENKRIAALRGGAGEDPETRRILAEAEAAQKKAEELSLKLQKTLKDNQAAGAEGAAAAKAVADATAAGIAAAVQQLTVNRDKLLALGQTDAAQVLTDQIKSLKAELASIPDVLPEDKLTDFQAKLAEGLRSFADTVQVQVGIIQGLVTTTGSFIANTLVDAFDPTKDTSIKEQFARFLQDIARLVITQLTQLAIAKAILGLTGAVGGLQGGGQVQGLRRGGRVRGYAGGGRIVSGPASPNHYGMRAPRPRGIHRKDTEPIWAQIGEFMHPVASVMKYGLGFMQDVQTGRFPVEVAQAFSGATTFAPGGAASAPTSSPARGMATGGSVGAGASVRERVLVQADGRESEVTFLPVLVTDRQSVDRMVSSRGGEALTDFNRRGASLQGALNSRKG